MTRRTGLAVSVAIAAMTVAFVAGCSAGQITQTDRQVPVVPGVNADAEVNPGPGRVAVRNVLVVYPGPEGYPQGGNAPIEARIFNDTLQPITVKVSSPDAASVRLTSSGAPSVAPSPAESPSPSPSPSAAASASPSGSPRASASASPSPSAPPRPAASAIPGAPAELEIAPASFAVLAPGATRTLTLVGLKRAIRSGQSVQVVFDFGGGTTIPLVLPVAPPLTPLARTPMVIEEGEHG